MDKEQRGIVKALGEKLDSGTCSLLEEFNIKMYLLFHGEEFVFGRKDAKIEIR